MKLALFVVFLGIFTCTAFVTLLGITGHLVIDREYLEPLFTSLILESIGSIILLFKATKFFDEQQQKKRRFCKHAAGHWWSIGAADDPVGFAQIVHDKSSDDLRVNGSAYDTNGQIVANWNDRASCIDPTKQTLYYAWEGHWPRNPNESREGFGQIRFDESKTDFSSGKGVFFDRNLSDVRSITMKTREWQRCTTEEIEDMKRKDSKIKGKLVRNKLIGKPRRNGENTFQLLKLRGLSSPKWSEIAVHDT